MTSTLIPTDEIEELVQSGIPTRALERHIDAADASIIDLYGAHTGERTVTLRGDHSLPRRPYWQRSWIRQQLRARALMATASATTAAVSIVCTCPTRGR